MLKSENRTAGMKVVELEFELAYGMVAKMGAEMVHPMDYRMDSQQSVALMAM